MQRGHNREPCFFCEDDYASYLYWLEKALRETGCALHAYVLMTNHVHLLLTPRKAAVPRLLMSLGRRYVQYINRYLQAHRHAVGQPLQIVARAGGFLSAAVSALHRAESGAGRDGELR